MNSFELQGYFDERGPALAAEQPPTRRQRIDVARQPLGGASLAGFVASQERVPLSHVSFEAEQ